MGPIVCPFTLAARRKVLGFPGGSMKRREFITLIGGAAALPLAARHSSRQCGLRGGVPRWRIPRSQLDLIFEEGLRSIGYRVGENVVIEYRFADGEVQRLPALAGPAGVDIIFVATTQVRLRP